MKKEIISAALACCIAAGSFGSAMALGSKIAAPFKAEDHLIRNSKNSYTINSLSQNITMNFYCGDDKNYYYDIATKETEQVSETYIMGDLDFNGEINLADIVAIRNSIMTPDYGDELFDKLADLDGNGTTNLADIVALRNVIMGINPKTEITISEGVDSTAAEWIKMSQMGIVIGDQDVFYRSEIRSATVKELHRTYDFMGNQDKMLDAGVEVEFEMNTFGYIFYVDVRVYDDGVAFRYRLPESGGVSTRTVEEETTTVVLRDEVDDIWYGISNKDYESEISKYSSKTASADHITAPMTAEVTGGGYISVQEAGVSESYGGINFVAKGDNTYRVSNTWETGIESKPYTINGDVTTGWRVIGIANTLDELVNNYIMNHVNGPADSETYADTSWIEPGRSSWSWLTDYGTSLKTADGMYNFTENSSKLGFEYNVIDDGYTQWANYDAELARLGLYGKENGVKQLLWAQVSTTNAGMKMENTQQVREYMDYLVAHDLYGGKIDFWWSEEDLRTQALQHDILKIAAEKQLVVNFHGCPKPGGISAAYPNELTREAVRGLENIGNAQNTDYQTQASFFTAQLFTRYLSGHADWTPACNTAMQIASLICIDSPLNVIATNPETILKNEAVEMIKSIPTVWEQTKVLEPSKIGELALYAKKTNGSWFVGGIASAPIANLTINASDFITDNGTYTMEIWQDESTTSKVKRVETITKDSIVNIGNLASATGFAARISKISLSEYGGEIIIGKPLSITTTDANAVVKYTTDGTDPMTSTTAKVYSSALQLDESCVFTAAITAGDGVGTVVRNKFNAVGGKNVFADIKYGKNSTTVSLTQNFLGDIHYTTDGTAPTAQSAKYTETLDITSECTLKLLGIPTNGSANITKDIELFVSGPDDVIPDLRLGKDYVEAKAEWGSCRVDTNLEGGVISLGGTNKDNGKHFAYGLGANAVAHYIYNIPEGATEFVGSVGIDDITYGNEKDGAQASATLSILFDDVEVLTTPIFRQGEYFNIRVDVPSGAQRIKIVFGDAKNGITCDNVSMGNAGWILGDKTANEVKYQVEEKTGFANVILSKNFDGDIYYTTNGSEPTTASAKYASVLQINASCTVKVLGVPENGSENVTLSIDVTVQGHDETPDIFLAETDLSQPATTGWSGDPASFDRNTKRDSDAGNISIAGIEYTKGISTNSVGEFIFNIPANASRFIGVVGVDDVTYKNTGDGHKASIDCKIYFNGSSTPVYTSIVLRQGQFDKIDIAVPSGATTIKIVFDEGGDGNTCDNASMGNAGWIIN